MTRKVKIYTRKCSTYCKAAKEFFRENKIKFEEVNIDRSTVAAKTMKKKSKQGGVPVIKIGRRIIVGFDVEKIEKALKINDKPPEKI